MSESPSPSSEARMRALDIRSRALQAIRTFFHERGFMEVETPVRLRAPALELHIDAEPSGDYFLRTSPELHMKRLLAEGAPRLFQMGPCFRRGERGDRHHPEYTMLEWYRANADYTDILADAKALVAHVATLVTGSTDLVYRGRHIELLPRWERIEVRDAFVQFAGWDPVRAFDPVRFDLDMVNKVEPRLPNGVPVVLADYPAEAAALARRKPGRPEVAERWELYIGGLELANAYSELTDPAEQRARFESCAEERKRMGKPVYPMDEDFLAALARMPASGGIALGVDRLVMLLANAASLDEVMAFRE
jgi:elongation factor P--(R)-beta-lysine ligase